MTIKLNTRVYNELHQLLTSRIFNQAELRNVEAVAWYLRTAKLNNLLDWIAEHPREYLLGLVEGFEIDNSQESQLKDIHTRKYL